MSERPRAGHLGDQRTNPEQVTRGDIEAKLAQIRGVADDTTEVAQEATKTAAIAGVAAVVVVAFLLGRRRGRKKSTIVEVRRI